MTPEQTSLVNSSCIFSKSQGGNNTPRIDVSNLTWSLLLSENTLLPNVSEVGDTWKVCRREVPMETEEVVAEESKES